MEKGIYSDSDSSTKTTNSNNLNKTITGGYVRITWGAICCGKSQVYVNNALIDEIDIAGTSGLDSPWVEKRVVTARYSMGDKIKFRETSSVS